MCVVGECSMFNSMSDLRKKNKKIGHHFFDRDTMRFWSSKIETGLYHGMFFVTSERVGTGRRLRKFTVRQALPTGEVITVGRFQSYESLDEAVAAIHETMEMMRQLKKISWEER